MFDFLKKKTKPETGNPDSPAIGEDTEVILSTSEAVRQTVGKSLFARTFGSLFSRNPKLDPDFLDELETALISADVGVPATAGLVLPNTWPFDRLAGPVARAATKG